MLYAVRHPGPHSESDVKYESRKLVCCFLKLMPCLEQKNFYPSRPSIALNINIIKVLYFYIYVNLYIHVL